MMPESALEQALEDNLKLMTQLTQARAALVAWLHFDELAHCVVEEDVSVAAYQDAVALTRLALGRPGSTPDA